MRSIFALFLALFGLIAAPPIVSAKDPDFLANRWVVILSVYNTFDAAHSDAKKIAKASNIQFSMRGRVFDKKRGLIYPDNFDDEIFRGQYSARRYHKAVLKVGEEQSEYLSVERSEGYDGFRKNLYLVVAGIHDSPAAAQAQAQQFAKWAPTAYAKKTKIYMGCLH